MARPSTTVLSARLWLRAYPRRWRATYGADLLGMLADVTPPGARTIPAREGLAVLRSGWALRWREHPPFWRWLGYRLLGRRLPARYRSWVIDDLLGPLYLVRVMGMAWALMLAVLAALGLLPPLAETPLETIVAPLVVAGAAFGTAALSKNGLRVSWSKHVGGAFPPQILPLRERRALRRARRGRV